MLDEKSKGKEIVIDTAPAPKRGQVVDIMEALKRSMERIPAKRNPLSVPRVRRKRVASSLVSVAQIKKERCLDCTSKK
jgi:non-homologous end joining protein Ku